MQLLPSSPERPRDFPWGKLPHGANCKENLKRAEGTGELKHTVFSMSFRSFKIFHHVGKWQVLVSWINHNKTRNLLLMLFSLVLMTADRSYFDQICRHKWWFARRIIRPWPSDKTCSRLLEVSCEVIFVQTSMIGIFGNLGKLLIVFLGGRIAWLAWL